MEPIKTYAYNHLKFHLISTTGPNSIEMYILEDVHDSKHNAHVIAIPKMPNHFQVFAIDHKTNDHLSYLAEGLDSAILNFLAIWHYYENFVRPAILVRGRTAASALQDGPSHGPTDTLLQAPAVAPQAPGELLPVIERDAHKILSERRNKRAKLVNSTPLPEETPDA